MAIPGRRILYVLSALGFAALLIRLIPLWRFGPFGFGYDSGFYRRYVIEPFVSFPNTPVPGLDHTVFIPRMILDVVRSVLHQPDLALYGTYVAFSLIGVWSVWYFAGQYVSENGSLYASALYVFSGIQFFAYHTFFFKEAIALPLFLFAVLFLEREWYGLATIAGVLVVLSQQTTSIILLCVAALGFIFQSILRRTISIRFIFSGTAIFATYLFLHPHVAQKIASPPVGVFVTQTEYILWSLPLLVLALFGFRRLLVLAKQKPIVAAAVLVPLVFAVFHLPFYNRIYVFLDMFLVIPAAFGVEVLESYLSSHARKLRTLLIACMFLVVSIPLIYLVYAQRPLIDASTQAALPALSALPASSAVITSPGLLPWVQGWSPALVYAPGNLKEPHPLNDWSRYWTHQDPQFERGFLSSFPRPLYVFAGQSEIQYRPVCGVQVSPNLFSLETCR